MATSLELVVLRLKIHLLKDLDLRDQALSFRTRFILLMSYHLNWAKKGIVHVHTLVLLIKNIGCSCGYLVLNMMRKLVKFGSGSINSYGRHRIAKLIKWGLKIICFRYDSWYFPQHRKPDYIVQTGLGKYFFIYWK